MGVKKKSHKSKTKSSVELKKSVDHSEKKSKLTQLQEEKYHKRLIYNKFTQF